MFSLYRCSRLRLRVPVVGRRVLGVVWGRTRGEVLASDPAETLRVNAERLRVGKRLRGSRVVRRVISCLLLGRRAPVDDDRVLLALRGRRQRRWERRLWGSCRRRGYREVREVRQRRRPDSR